MDIVHTGRVTMKTCSISLLFIVNINYHMGINVGGKLMPVNGSAGGLPSYEKIPNHFAEMGTRPWVMLFQQSHKW